MAIDEIQDQSDEQKDNPAIEAAAQEAYVGKGSPKDYHVINVQAKQKDVQNELAEIQHVVRSTTPDVIKGEFTPETRKAWKDLFNHLSSKPNTSSDEIVKLISDIVIEIGLSLAIYDLKHHDEKNLIGREISHSNTLFIVIAGPGIDNKDAMRNKRDTPTCIVLGTLRNSRNMI